MTLTTGKPLLQVTNLKVHFKLKRETWFSEPNFVHAVDGVSLNIKKGQTVGLVGESGCGKTTTGRALLGLVKPSGGHVLYNDSDIITAKAEKMLALRKEMQIIFQDPYSALNPRQTAGEIVMDPLLVHGIGTSKERKQRSEDLFAMVGLRKNQLALYPHQFSGGQRQRICIARALALSPKFIVCDEPVSALDVAIQAQVLNLLCKLQDELSLTYLFISHDLAVVQHMCDEIAVMYLGVIVEKANRKSLFDNPRHPYTRALLSAVLTSEHDKKTERIRLEGDIPSPINKPSGCRFRTRCKHAQQICSELEPVLEEKSPGHFEACHFNTTSSGGLEFR